jgi:hypothetical protein
MTDLDKSPAVPYDLVTRGPTIGPTKNYNPDSGSGTPGGVDQNIQYNNAGSFGGLTDVQVTARIQLFTTTLSGSVPAPGSVAGKVLSDNGTWIAQSGGGAPGGANGNLQFNNSGSFGGLTDVQVTARIQQFTTALSGAVPASGSATGTHFIRDDGIWAIPAGGGGGTPGGPNLSVQYNNAGAFGGYTNIQLTALIQSFTSSLSGAVPSSGGGVLNFLRADATWANTLGGVAGGTGVLNLAGNTSGVITIQPQAAAGTYNFNLPTTVGVAGQVLQAAGSASPMAWTYTPTLGAVGNTGKISFAGTTSGVVTIQPQSVAGTWNFNLPIAAGTAGQVLTSQGGGATAMTWTNPTPGITGPGTTVKGAPPIWSTTVGGTVIDGTSPINVLAYGADPTGAASSDIAFANAHTAASAIFGTIYIPPGTYKLTTAWNITGGNIRIIGEGSSSIIKQSLTTPSVIVCTGSSVIFENLSLTYTSTATSAVAALAVGTGAAIFDVRCNNVYISKCYHGIIVQNQNGGYYRNLNIGPNTGTAFWINTSSNIDLDNFSFTNTATPPSTSCALQMTGPSQGNTICNGECYQSYFPLILGGGGVGIANNPAYCKFVNVFFDSGTREAFIQEAYEVTFVDCWHSNGRNVGGAGNFPGANISGGSGIHYIGGQAFSCGSHGYVVNAGTNITFNGVSAISNSNTAGLGSAHGITIAAGITDFSIIGCTCKNISSMSGTSNQGWGIIVVAGASDRYIIHGNLISTNVTGGVSDAGAGVNKLVAGNF